MAIKTKRKPVSLHEALLDRGFKLEKVVETHEKVTGQIRKYSSQVEHSEIDTFSVIPGRLVQESKPEKMSKQFYDNNSFAIYVKRYG